MDNNFSTQVKEIISYSREEALRLGNDFIGTEHLLLGLIREGEGLAIRVLQTMQVDLFDLRKELEVAIKDKGSKPLANINSLPLTKQAEKVIRVTVLEAKALKSPQVETEHLMLSILKNKENIATQILNQFEKHTSKKFNVEKKQSHDFAVFELHTDLSVQLFDRCNIASGNYIQNLLNKYYSSIPVNNSFC